MRTSCVLALLIGVTAQRGILTCIDTCDYSSDGDCDDGGPGAEFAECVLGSDCFDCGQRTEPSPPPSPPAPPLPPLAPPPAIPPAMRCDLLVEDNVEQPASAWATAYCDQCEACSGYCPRCPLPELTDSASGYPT